MADFCQGRDGFRFFLQRSQKYLDPSDIFFKGADKKSTLETKGAGKNLRVQIFTILRRGGWGGADKKWNGQTPHPRIPVVHSSPTVQFRVLRLIYTPLSQLPSLQRKK